MLVDRQADTEEEAATRRVAVGATIGGKMRK
jgi:hypothetical protein